MKLDNRIQERVNRSAKWIQDLVWSLQDENSALRHEFDNVGLLSVVEPPTDFSNGVDFIRGWTYSLTTLTVDKAVSSTERHRVGGWQGALTREGEIGVYPTRGEALKALLAAHRNTYLAEASHISGLIRESQMIDELKRSGS